MRSPDPARPRARECEWLGGRYALPRKLQQHSEAIQPEVVLWLELPSGALVSMSVVGPEAPRRTFEETLAEAMKNPAEGPARKPRRIRVPEQALADALKGTIGSDTTVVVAPVPELDTFFAEVVGGITPSGYSESYLADGEISPGVVADLFAAASAYYRAAPWRHVKDRQVVRIDIPALDVEGRGLAIIGDPGESIGLLLFQSEEYYGTLAKQAFHPSEEEALREPTLPRLAVSLSFNRKKDLPTPMLDEIEAHGWAVAGAKAYPRVTGLDEDVTAQYATERDYQVLAACAWALVAFFARYPKPFVFGRDELKTMCESFTGEGGVPVTITAPYEPVLISIMLDDILDPANREDQ